MPSMSQLEQFSKRQAPSVQGHSTQRKEAKKWWSRFTANFTSNMNLAQHKMRMEDISSKLSKCKIPASEKKPR